MTPPEDDMNRHILDSLAELRDEMREERRDSAKQVGLLHRKIDTFIQTMQTTCAVRGVASAVIRAELTTHLKEHEQRPERWVAIIALIVAMCAAVAAPAKAMFLHIFSPK